MTNGLRTNFYCRRAKEKSGLELSKCSGKPGFDLALFIYFLFIFYYFLLCHFSYLGLMPTTKKLRTVLVGLVFCSGEMVGV
jgi:hypothetical protein